MATKTSELLVRLAELADEAGKNYYERIKIADAILQDRQWIASEFRGDDYKAAEMMEEKFFHDLSGSMTIWMLLQIYRKYPEQSEWRKAKYNLRTLWAQCKPEPQAKTPHKVIKKSEYEKVVQEAKEAKFEVRQKEKVLQDKESELDKLRRRVKELEEENLKLKGRVEQLERIVQGRMGKAG